MTPNTHEHPPSLTALTCQPPHLKVPGLNNCTFYHSVHAKLHNYILICRFVVPTNPPPPSPSSFASFSGLKGRLCGRKKVGQFNNGHAGWLISWSTRGSTTGQSVHSGVKTDHWVWLRQVSSCMDHSLQESQLDPCRYLIFDCILSLYEYESALCHCHIRGQFQLDEYLFGN